MTSSAATSPSLTAASTSTVATTAATTTDSTSTPAIPARPATLTAAVNQNASTYSRPYGSTPYSTYSSYSSYTSPYSSPYNRFGYGGYGSYGGMYGGYGGYGGMYGGMPPYGMADPNNPNSLTQRFSMSTQATFQMLEGIVHAFGGFAQMLESTYMATHSSFFGESCCLAKPILKKKKKKKKKRNVGTQYANTLQL